MKIMWVNPVGKPYADEAIAALIRDIKSAEAEVEFGLFQDEPPIGNRITIN